MSKRLETQLFDFLATLMIEREHRRAAFTGTPQEFENSPTEMIISQSMKQLETEYYAILGRAASPSTK